MAETTWQDGHKVCSRGCGRLVYNEHQQFPGVCLDCAQPALKEMQASTRDLIDGKQDVATHNERMKAATIDPAPAAEA